MRDDAVLRRALPLGRGLGRLTCQPNMKHTHTYMMHLTQHNVKQNERLNKF